VKCKVRNFSCEEKDELCKRYKLKDDETVSPPDEFAIKILDKSTIVAEDMAVQICQVQSKYFWAKCKASFSTTFNFLK